MRFHEFSFVSHETLWQSSGKRHGSQQQKVTSQSKFKQTALCSLRSAIIDISLATGVTGICGVACTRTSCLTVLGCGLAALNRA